MPKKQRPTRASQAPTKQQRTVHLDNASIAQLEDRGARSDRGGGARATSAVLRRRLAILESLIIHCDPRFTCGFPDAFYDFVVARLTAPWSLPPDRIAALEAHLSHLPGFDEAAHAAGIDPTALRDALKKLSFAEKLALVDAAEVHHTRSPAAHDGR